MEGEARQRKPEQKDGGKSSGGRKKKKGSSSPPSGLGILCRVFISLFGLFLIYFIFFSPCEIDPLYIEDTPAMKYEGAMAPNDRSFEGGDRLFTSTMLGPESQAFDEDGNMYTGSANGVVWKWDMKSPEPIPFVTTGSEECDTNVTKFECGRPLGIRVIGDRLIVADALVGLLEIDLETLEKRVLVAHGKEIDGVPVNFVDDVTLAPDGKYYFSDACARWTILRVMYSVLERRPNGRLLSYDPHSGEVKVVVRNMYFANGVELSHDKKSLLVPETMMYRVVRVHLGDKLGQTETILENLPGYPDNIRRHPEGGYIIGVSAMRDGKADFGARHPIVRTLAAKLLPYDQLGKLSEPYGLCIHISENGEILHSWHDTTGRLHHTTQCVIHDGHMYIASFVNHGIGRIRL